jgi:hypothetical protein
LANLHYAGAQTKRFNTYPSGEGGTESERQWTVVGQSWKSRPAGLGVFAP